MSADGAGLFILPRASPERASRRRLLATSIIGAHTRAAPGTVVADLGCGVSGPLLEIVRFSGAKIVGVISNAYKLERARRLAEEAELTHLAEFLHCDFLPGEMLVAAAGGRAKVSAGMHPEDVLQAARKIRDMEATDRALAAQPDFTLQKYRERRAANLG